MICPRESSLDLGTVLRKAPGGLDLAFVRMPVALGGSLVVVVLERMIVDRQVSRRLRASSAPTDDQATCSVGRRCKVLLEDGPNERKSREMLLVWSGQSVRCAPARLMHCCVVQRRGVVLVVRARAPAQARLWLERCSIEIASLASLARRS